MDTTRQMPTAQIEQFWNKNRTQVSYDDRSNERNLSNCV